MSMTAPLSELPMFREPNPERAEKERVLQDLEGEDYRARVLELIRAQMVRLYRARRRDLPVEKAVVTPDDARRFFEEELNPPPPDKLSRNFLGAVFRTKSWEKVGRYESRTTNSHANELNTYRYVGEG